MILTFRRKHFSSGFVAFGVACVIAMAVAGVVTSIAQNTDRYINRPELLTYIDKKTQCSFIYPSGFVAEKTDYMYFVSVYFTHPQGTSRFLNPEKDSTHGSISFKAGEHLDNDMAEEFFREQEADFRNLKGKIAESNNSFDPDRFVSTVSKETRQINGLDTQILKNTQVDTRERTDYELNSADNSTNTNVEYEIITQKGLRYCELTITMNEGDADYKYIDDMINSLRIAS